MKKILVVGGAGFLGSYVVACEERLGNIVRIMDPKEVKMGNYQASIFDEPTLKSAVLWSDAVIHLAAFSNVNNVLSDPKNCIKINIDGTVSVIEAIRNNKKQPLIFLSSYFTKADYGGLYATTKLASEMILYEYAGAYDLDVRIIRLGSLYGEKSRGEDVISVMSKSLIKNQKIFIHGDGSQKRSYIHGWDAANGVHSCLEYNHHDEIKYKKFYLVGKRFTTLNQLAQIFKGIKPELEIQYIKNRDYEIGNINISMEKIIESREVLSWMPSIKLEDGVRKVVSLMSSHDL